METDIKTDNYEILRCDTNRHIGSVAFYIRKDLNYNIIPVFPSDFECIFFKILLSNSKPIIVRTIYYLPNKWSFSEVLNENMNKIDPIINEIYIRGDFNVDLFLNDSSNFLKISFVE